MPAAAQPPAAPLETPRAATRADILRAANSLSPWQFIPPAQQALDQQPGDDDLRLALLEHLSRLGLRTAAAELAAGFSSRARTDPRVPAAIDHVARLPDDRIPLATLESTCRVNVDALARRSEHAVNLRLHAAVWRSHAAHSEWFRASDGNIVRRRRTPDGRATWVHFQNALAGVQGYRYTPSGAPDPGLPPASPIVLEGLDPPWLFRQLCAEHPARPDGYWVGITVLQADPLELLDGLAHVDLTLELSQARVRVLVGPEAGQRFTDHLLTPERQDCVVTGPVLTASGIRTRAAPTPANAITAAAEAQEQSLPRLRRAIDTRSGSRNPAHYRDRFASGAPLRVLIITCRFTTFVKHSAADLRVAFESQGHQVRTVVEPDDSSWMRPLAIVRAVHEHDPDLVVAINYGRRDMSGCLPADVPVLNWVQDAMPHLLTADAGAAIGPRDFVIGNLYHEHVERFGFPPAQVLRAPMVANAAKFHDGPVAPSLRDRLTCDIAYVSHHSQLPEALHAERLAQLRDDVQMCAALRALFPAILSATDAALTMPLSTRLIELTRDALRAERIDLDEGAISRLAHIYTFPIADRALRHRTLGWTAEIARRRGWTLHIYGRAWDSHPTLAPFARGELAHGEDLRAAYACARVHLQASLHKALHQRVVECALAGGLPIFRIHADDVAFMQFLAASTLANDHAPVASLLPSVPPARNAPFDPFVGFRIDEHEPARRVEALRRDLGLESREFVWFRPSHAPRARALSLGLGSPDDLFWLCPCAREMVFASPETLEAVLERAVADPKWRASSADSMRRVCREHLTHDGFVRSALRFIGEGLGRERAR